MELWKEQVATVGVTLSGKYTEIQGHYFLRHCILFYCVNEENLCKKDVLRK
jgi:hypothetical protein